MRHDPNILLAFSIAWILAAGSARGEIAFEQHTFQLPASASGMATHDLDGDGDLDFAMAESAADRVVVILNDGTGGVATVATYPVGDQPWLVVGGELNGDGAIDLVVVYEGSPELSILHNDGDGNFSLVTGLTVAPWVRSLAIVDVDVDGGSDLVVDHGDGCSILVNAGDGATFVETRYALPGSGYRVAAGDLDQDGAPDLVAGNHDQIVLLANEGTGTFAVPQDVFPESGAREDVGMCDLNGDGAVDLISLDSYSDEVETKINNGDGTFADAVAYAVGARPSALALGDIDDDSDMDLVVANRASGDISLLWNDATGGFVVETGYGLPVGQDATAIALGDTDGDGDLDIAVVSDSDQVWVRQNNELTRTFDQFRRYDTAGASPRSVALGDLDGDHNADLVVTSAVGVEVRFSTGSGIDFTAPSVHAVGDQPWGSELGDLDGDGDLDIVVANRYSEDVSVLRNLGSRTFAPAVEHAVDRSVFSVALGDLDGDGDLDVTASAWYTQCVLLNDSTGDFGPAKTYLSDGAASAVGDIDGDGDLDVVSSDGLVQTNAGDGTFLAPTIPGWVTDELLVDDMDGDGDTDIVTIYGDQVWAFWQESGAFIPEQLDEVSSASAAIAAQLDADGYLDLAVIGYEGQGIVSLWLSGGGGGTSTFGRRPTSIAAGDVDGDTDVDVVVTTWTGLLALLNDGAGALNDTMTIRPVTHPWTVELGDVDGDGDPDLVIANTSSSLSILSNRGDGLVGDETIVPLTRPANTIETAHLDGDDALDIVLADGAGVTILFDGTTPVEHPIAGGTVSSVAVGDLDADGDSDLAVLSRGVTGGYGCLPDHGSLTVLLNAGDGSMTELGTYDTGPNSSDVALGDLDGDGDLDYAAANSGHTWPIWEENGCCGASISILLNDGTGAMTNAGSHEIPSESDYGDHGLLIEIDDLNGDAHADLIVYVGNCPGPFQFFPADIRWFENRGNATFEPPVATATAPYWPGETPTGDLDGDGDVDVVGLEPGGAWPFEPESVSVYVNTDGQGTLSAVPISESNATHLDVGDLDGDGDLDVVAVDQGSSQVAILRNTLATPCHADLGGDAKVGFADLTALLSAWGTCAGPCPADLNYDERVGFADLTAMLAAWGPCP